MVENPFNFKYMTNLANLRNLAKIKKKVSVDFGGTDSSAFQLKLWNLQENKKKKRKTFFCTNK